MLPEFGEIAGEVGRYPAVEVAGGFEMAERLLDGKTLDGSDFEARVVAFQRAMADFEFHGEVDSGSIGSGLAGSEQNFA